MKSEMFSGKDVFREKLLKFCQYRDRCQKEFEQKMWELKIPKEWQDELMLEFIHNDWINEERFAKNLTRGKFRINHWGRIKITNLLKSYHIYNGLIEKAMEEIPEDEYVDLCQELGLKKFKGLTDSDVRIKKQKCVQYLLQKGFEYEIISKLEWPK
ncbi:MAG: RecX family transcriptional regulator [Saprospiraceae bacterium]|nr:RecX family transcriptional regulator [Saprospiraceae bacterium]